MSDSVIHIAFIHDFSKYANCETDRRAIEALGSALAGSGRSLIVTSGTILLAPGRVAAEEVVSAATPLSISLDTMWMSSSPVARSKEKPTCSSAKSKRQKGRQRHSASIPATCAHSGCQIELCNFMPYGQRTKLSSAVFPDDL